MTEPDTSAEAFISDLCRRASKMTDDELLSQINAHDPLDAEFARRFRALAAERDALTAALSRTEAQRDAYAEEEQEEYDRAKAAVAKMEAVARVALARAAFRADAYHDECAREIRQLSPAAIVRGMLKSDDARQEQ